MEMSRGKMVTIQYFVIYLDGDHLRLDILALEQIEDSSLLNLLRLSIDLELHRHSQVSLEIKEF
jgi:hypothetical protein